MLSSKVVTPVKTGVQCFCNPLKSLDSGFHRNDDSWTFLTFDEFVKKEDQGKFGLTSRNSSDKRWAGSRVQVVIHRQKLCTVLAEGKLPNTHEEALH